MHVHHGPGFICRYGSRRAGESSLAGEPGQDYLTLRYDERALVFVLCDGVSQSFYGNLAARFLGDALRDWLWGWEKGNLLVELDRYLRSLTGPAQEMVLSVSLPSGLPAIVAEVLEAKRQLGSEAMFACGRVNQSGQALLAWMGDVRLRLWLEGGEIVPLGGDSRRRWSSVRGPVGALEIHFAAGVRRIVAYTDGLDLSLGALEEALVTGPDHDDRTLLDISGWG